MKITYNSIKDILNIIFKENTVVIESNEEKPGVIFDYDDNDDLVSLEILDASKRIDDIRKSNFEIIDE